MTPLFSWLAIGVTFLIVLGFYHVIDLALIAARERRARRDQEHSYQRARLQLASRIGGTR